MTPAAQTLVAEIGRDLMRAGDALYEARVKFNELRRLLHGGEVVVDAEFSDPAVDAAAPAADRRHPPLPLLKRDGTPKLGGPGTALHPAGGHVIGVPAYKLNGKPVSVPDLAALAGCRPGTMQYRLKTMGMTPEAAVAAGARMLSGPVPTHTYNGQKMFASDLAKLAGCSLTTMHKRLTVGGMTPEEAVAVGKCMKRRAYRKTDIAKGDAGVAPPAPPTRAKSVFDVTPATGPVPRKPQEMALDPKAAVIIPPGVKRTVAPTPPDRFAPTFVPSTFGRIGSYERTGSALERALEGKP